MLEPDVTKNVRSKLDKQCVLEKRLDLLAPQVILNREGILFIQLGSI